MCIFLVNMTYKSLNEKYKKSITFVSSQLCLFKIYLEKVILLKSNKGVNMSVR